MAFLCSKILENENIKEFNRKSNFDIFEKRSNFDIFIIFTEELLNEELKHLEKVFREKNHFPKWLIRNVMNEVNNKHQRSDIRNPISIDNNISVEEIEQKQHLLILPYQVKSLQKRLHNLLPDHINTQVTYTGKKLSTCFNIKDQTV